MSRWVAAPQSYAAAVPSILFWYGRRRCNAPKEQETTRLYFGRISHQTSAIPPAKHKPQRPTPNLASGFLGKPGKERGARVGGREKSQDRPEPKEQNPLRLCHTSSARFLFACCSSTHYLIPDYCHLRLSSLASHWCRRSQFLSALRSLGAAASLFFFLLPLHRHRTYKLDSPRCAPQSILLKHEAKSFVNFFSPFRPCKNSHAQQFNAILTHHHHHNSHDSSHTLLQPQSIRELEHAHLMRKELCEGVN